MGTEKSSSDCIYHIHHLFHDHIVELIYLFFYFLVASMLEIARLIVDSGWVPPQPVIFLFNGAEELFLLVHGLIRFIRGAKCSKFSYSEILF